MEHAIHIQILLAAFAGGAVLGAVAQKTNFCTLGAVSDWVNMGHTGRMRSWVFAMAVALAAVTVMEAWSGLDPKKGRSAPRSAGQSSSGFNKTKKHSPPKGAPVRF